MTSPGHPEPLLLAVAPNGARRTKADHPAVPLTPEEIAAEAARCAEAGATMLHLHVRDSGGRHSLDPHRYRHAIEAVRAAVGSQLVVQITTESVGAFTPAEQMQCVRAVRPEAASFAIRELIPDASAEREAAPFFAWVAGEGIGAQFIVYAPDEAARFADLVARRVLPFDRPNLLYVLGRHARDGVSDPADLLPFLAAPRPDGCVWTVCAFGRTERAAAAVAVALGGYVRVGFENNLEHPDGRPLASTAEQAGCVAELAARVGRPLASPEEARLLLGVRR